MSAAANHPPGADWVAIISRSTVAEFARSFAADAVLEGSVLPGPIIGVSGIRAFFQTTRGMYDRIAFTAEHRSAFRTCLEWEGNYRGSPIAGLTVLTTDAADLITSIRLFHLPLDPLLAFAADLHTRVGLAVGEVR